MKGSIYNRLWIPKPCHEDWNKMTPDEKGAFCRSCNKSVYDFTNKNAEQVESILSAASGEVCGRFNSSQLAPLPELEIPFHALPRNLSPYRKFVLAVFLVFGTTLFGCVNTYGQKMGKVKLVENNVLEEEITMKGEVAFIPEDTTATEVIGDTVVLLSPPVDEMHILGGISLLPNDVPLDVKEHSNAASENSEQAVVSCGLAQMNADTGSVAVTELPLNYADAIEKINPGNAVIRKPVCQKGEEDEGIPDVKDPVEQSGTEEEIVADNNRTAVLPAGDPGLLIECYPNPSAGQVNIRYEIKKRTDVKLELFDRSGKRVRTLVEQQGHYNGIYNTLFDLSDLGAGTYLCVLQADGMVKTAKIIISK